MPREFPSYSADRFAGKPTDPRSTSGNYHPDFEINTRIDQGACFHPETGSLYYTIPRDGNPFGMPSSDVVEDAS